jgi:hypothetical protein
MVGHNIASCPNDWTCLECSDEFGTESARMQHGEAEGHTVEH